LKQEADHETRPFCTLCQSINVIALVSSANIAISVCLCISNAETLQLNGPTISLLLQTLYNAHTLQRMSWRQVVLCVPTMHHWRLSVSALGD